MKKTPSPQMMNHGQTNPQNGYLENKNPKKTHGSKSFKDVARKVSHVLSFMSCTKESNSSGLQVVDVHDHGRDFATSEDMKALSGEKFKRVSYTIEEIIKGTANFSTANKIGEGGFGIVYRAKLKDGSFVAVKRVKKKNLNDRTSSTEFRNEILTLAKIEHLNLVKFFGFLEQRDEHLIIVEYVGNGTLREHLDGICGKGLEIGERLDIAIDVAHAVTYLHTYTDPPIIHRDIKASNILITEKLRAKVADFGIARLAPEDPGATHISTEVKGTAGQPIDLKKPVNERITIKWALKKLKDGDYIMTMDQRLRRNPASIMVVEKVLKLARQCLAPSRQNRPLMKKCVETLWRIRKEYNEKCVNAATSAFANSANVVEGDARKNRHNYFGIEDSESYRFRSA
ncbi:Receptor-like protein kinase THESEUS 1 [Heracleum sosnowskyi]|uniref:Receptor-like protein kinase THESEUS 1 n=1 Tax=Heracleum sosnowskyi TaxID=360622 RepID=A0AAD8H0A4_9APIA|nr:Receptor-like protein kinase THESEUS 1 [Heracleum sosnowskyi]